VTGASQLERPNGDITRQHRLHLDVPGRGLNSDQCFAEFQPCADFRAYFASSGHKARRKRGTVNESGSWR